jgi:hypothetical protein
MSSLGILVYSRGNEWEKAVYERLCGGKIILLPAIDLTASYVTVSDRLRQPGVLPKVFIAEEGVRSYFDLERYKGSHSFNDFPELRVYHILESPSLLEMLAVADHAGFKRACALGSEAIDIHTICQRFINRDGSLLTRSCNEVVLDLDWDKIISKTPAFRELAGVLGTGT